MLPENAVPIDAECLPTTRRSRVETQGGASRLAESAGATTMPPPRRCVAMVQAINAMSIQDHTSSKAIDGGLQKSHVGRIRTLHAVVADWPDGAMVRQRH